MASSPTPPGGHLDATHGREVVFCHQCRHEWYKDEHPTLKCPSPTCGSEATEIVQPGDSDPRGVQDVPLIPGFSFRGDRRRRASSDLDPDEGDIDDHTGTSPSVLDGFFMHHRVFRPPPTQGHTQDSDAILRRFAEMLTNDFGGPRGDRAASNRDPLFPSAFGSAQEAWTGRSSGTGAPRYHHTTFRAGPSGNTSVTITTGTMSSDGPVPGFPALFGQLMGATMLPDANNPNRQGGAGSGAGSGAGRGAGSGAGRPLPGGMGFATGLHEILATLLNPQSAVHGDAVYTQEALDRIITSLMEANPQSNAAPPATQAAINQLEKKKVDEKMLGAEGKAECTICIDELTKGDEVTVLPCTHWFHGECVTLWLKEHNTCPICRAPIEGGDNQNGNTQQPQRPEQSQPSQEPERAPWSWTNFSTSSSPSGTPRSGLRSPGAEQRRTPQENEDRLNAIRNLNAYRSSDSQAGLPRRNSASPSTFRAFSDQAAFRPRVRSPSLTRPQELGSSPPPVPGAYPSSRDNRESRETSNRDSHTPQSSHGSHGGALAWLRNLTRGSGSGSDRERR
ncbi:hypothetical protein B0T25DRAFT_454157 [Lasiosphaeria hispida]|uniref:RING-type E3 ubiquitin transferase n=1 Tax=Lasiosphaeria hispida TaxID=260671 RepID=A0AAJ0HGR2_9PEZI|nr:hypothetical protein B0T25DRAFT_454157 [Lasiosphaeria hispida]